MPVQSAPNIPSRNDGGAWPYLQIATAKTPANFGPKASLTLLGPAHALRGRAEACICRVYQRAFNARKLTFPKLLVAWIEDDGDPVCVAGLRTTHDGFFSEAYLDERIERILSNHTGRQVERGTIFEITTFASERANVSPPFLSALWSFGISAGFDWTFFTATFELRGLLRWLGIPVIDLAPADPARLPDAGRWGSYYTHSPRVCAINGSGWLRGDDAVAGSRSFPHA